MKIVVLVGYTLNPGDLSWEALSRQGELAVHDRTPPEETLARAQGAQAVFTNKTPLDRRLLAQLPELRFIGVLATGYDVVDVTAARERGIVVANVPAYGAMSVAQLVFALLLELTHRAGAHDRWVHGGGWSSAPDFCYWDGPLIELDGLTLGLVGLGRIGRAVARIGQTFGMAVIAHDPNAPETPPGVTPAELDEVFRGADVVSLHCPLTAQTERLADARRLALMKPTAFFLNTARGPLVDEQALAKALNAGRLAGAGLDVLSREPPPADHPLLRARNCVITPHLAWATAAARRRLLAVAAENVASFVRGRPRNVVS
jgi:glycerate dehydrogenase